MADAAGHAKPLGVVIDPTDRSGTNPTLDLASEGR